MENEQTQAMDMAAAAAEQDLRKLLDGMSKEQREGAAQLAGWMKANYLKAGYKRLSKTMLAVVQK